MSNSRFPQPTIRDLARSLSLSKSTVSAALLENGRISLKTRGRVQERAREMGYRRNAFAATLATRKSTKALGLDVAVISHVPIDEEYRAYECTSILGRLEELGYTGRHYDIEHDKIPLKRLLSMLYSRGFKGIIFDQIYTGWSELFSENLGPFCLVCAGRTYGKPPFDLIRSNPIEVISLAWKETRKRGYQRIGFLLCRHDPVLPDDTDRESSLWACQRSLVRGEQAIPPFLGAITDRSLFEKWFHLHKPDVIAGFNHLHIYWLQEMGLRVPQDIAFLDLHLLDPSGKVAGVWDCKLEMKIRTAEHMDVLIRHEKTGFQKQPWEMLGPVYWVPGETLPGKQLR